MGSVLDIGTRALQANQVALQTAGNNIANVNTTGYSRQSVVLQTVAGQYTGGGYIGNGVAVQTVQRNMNAFLTQQALLAGSVQSADSSRSSNLSQLENIFQGGTDGLGQSISNMLNSFSDVASAPTDLTARTVALTQVNETASRMRASQQSLDDLQSGLSQQLSQDVTSVNSIASNIASVNGQISKALATGQSPNDLLDQRDQLLRQLNQYVQTTSVTANDGTLGVFIGGSQALVLGTTASPVSIVQNDFNDPAKSKLAISANGKTISIDENNLGGGEVSGMLRFQNNDLVDARNQLGRLTLAITTAMNQQHQLGLDLNGKPGSNLFTPPNFGGQNIMQPVPPANPNAGNASLGLSISDVSQFVASDYQVNFTSATTGTITRESDGTVTNFPQSPPTTAPVLATVDGLNISLNAGTAQPGDRYLIKPFATVASTVNAVFSSPASLAVASPIVGTMGAANTGSLSQVALTTISNPPTNVPVTLTFTGANSYTRSDDPNPSAPTVYSYTSGVAIQGAVPPTTPASGWTLTLQGSPLAGDSYTVTATPASFVGQNSGNATALSALRDKAMFDGSALTDGYAGVIAEIGTRAQSANYASKVSTSIAQNLETQRTAVSGVNLDEEAANLLKFQQAYQASAKVIQIANSIFTTLIQSLGN